MKGKTILILFVVLLFVGLFFIVDREGAKAPWADDAVSGRTGEVATISEYTELDTISATSFPFLTGQLLVNGPVERLAEKKNSSAGGLLFLILYTCLLTALVNNSSSLFSILLTCLGFTEFRMSQIKILHRMDGKKRVYLTS